MPTAFESTINPGHDGSTVVCWLNITHRRYGHVGQYRDHRAGCAFRTPSPAAGAGEAAGHAGGRAGWRLSMACRHLKHVISPCVNLATMPSISIAEVEVIYQGSIASAMPHKGVNALDGLPLNKPSICASTFVPRGYSRYRRVPAPIRADRTGAEMVRAANEKDQQHRVQAHEAGAPAALHGR